MRNPTRRAFFTQAACAGITWTVAGNHPRAATIEKNLERKQLTVLTLSGTPQERGRTHGRTLKEPIHALVKLWKADLTERYALPADTFIQKFLKDTDYIAAMKRWTPGLLEEVRGIAQGS